MTQALDTGVGLQVCDESLYPCIDFLRIITAELDQVEPRVGRSTSAGKYSATLCQTMSFIASIKTLESTVSIDSGLCAINALASRKASMKLL